MGIGKDSVALDAIQGGAFQFFFFYLTGQHNQRLARAESASHTQTPNGINHWHVIM